MARLIADLESDGLLEPNKKGAKIVSKIHCLVAQDLDSGEVRCYHDDPSISPRAGGVEAGLLWLLQADLRAGHNWLGYDEKVIARLHPGIYETRNLGATVRDTQVGAEVVWPFEWLKGMDASRAARRLSEMPRDLIGKHALKAWGFRIGNRKAEYSGDFQTFTQDMLDYCVQDVSTTATLFKRLESRIEKGLFSYRAWDLEQAFKPIIDAQMAKGVLFDMAAADALTARLQSRRAELDDELVKLFPPFEDRYVTPKKQIEKVRVTPFNPGSRFHVARVLQERHGWKPSKRGGYTPSGQVKIDEQVLEGLRKYPGVDRLIERMVVDKRLSQLSEPKKKDAVPWTKMVREDGRIHGRVRHAAAQTGRCTHSSPNLTAVPRVGSPYGAECRGLFIVPKGYKMVGGDLKGIQLRLLAHHLVPYDDGKFREEVLHGDPHESNRIALGLPEGKKYRDQSKVFQYACLFGAGAGKVSQILECSFPRAKLYLERYMQNRPAYAAFKRKVGRLHHTRGTLRGPDGRHAFTRAENSAIATALQLGEAVLMKQTQVLAHARFAAEGLDVAQILFLHDECQFEAREDHAERVATIFKESAAEAGRMLELRVPIEADVKIGNSWLETH